jgi:transcriptional regulator with XRE-family HTH domain
MAEQLKAWRKAHGLTQHELAHLLGLDTMTISRWERAATEPPYRLLELALAELDRRLRSGEEP